MFADGRFPTDDGRARLVPVAQKPLPAPLEKWPLTLNSGRYRDQWHTMTRTGLSPKLPRHRPEPLVELHPRARGQWAPADRRHLPMPPLPGRSPTPLALPNGDVREDCVAP